MKIHSPDRLLPLLALLSAIATVSTLAPAARADNAPDWMRTASHDTLPDYPKDAVAVTLFEDEQITVKDNGDIERHYRVVYKLLRPESRRQYDAAFANFDNDTKISFFKAWTITADGKEFELKEKDSMETNVSSFEVFSDRKMKFLRYIAAEPGNFVGYEIIQKVRPQIFDTFWNFQDTIPVRKSRFTIQLPQGWEYKTLWGNHAEVPLQTVGPNTYSWEVADVPMIEVEPEMPPWPVVAGHMIAKLYPRDPALRPKTTGSWNDIGIWYEGLLSSRRVATPELKQKVAELTAGLTDPLDKIKALAAFSQRDIRYAAIEIGIGGYQPHSAGDVLAHHYGDCKDKATLLNTMLGEIGVESYNVLIDTERGFVRPDFPLTRFNHSIVAIKLPEGVSTTMLHAIVNDPKLGRLLFFDPTSEYTPLGSIPPYEQSSYALVVTPTASELIEVPLAPPATNRLLRSGTLTLTTDGSLAGVVREIRWGTPATDTRRQYLSTAPNERGKIVEEFLSNSLSNVSLKDSSIVNLEKYDDSLVVDYKFAAVSYAKSAGDLLIVRPRVLGNKGVNLSSKQRKYPIEFPEATRQDDLFDITLPAGYVVDELPEPVSASCPWGSYKSEVHVKDNVLHYKRTYEITALDVPTEKLDEVREFLRTIYADEKSSAVLRKAVP